MYNVNCKGIYKNVRMSTYGFKKRSPKYRRYKLVYQVSKI